MAEQTRMIELPFDQLELSQLELFLNRELNDDWVLVKIEENKFYFEKRKGDAYCYQVRLYVARPKWEENLLSIEEKQKRYIKAQELAGWKFMGELHDWYIFRSLKERHPVITPRDFNEEYKTLRLLFFKREMLNVFSRCTIWLIVLLAGVFFSPVSLLTSNYMLGIIMGYMLLMILAGLEIKVWLTFRQITKKQMTQNYHNVEDNALLIKASYRHRHNIYFVRGGALLLFAITMMMDGLYLGNWRIMAATLLIGGVFLGEWIESAGKKHFYKRLERGGKILYLICLSTVISLGITHGANSIETTYKGNEALQIKHSIEQLGLITLKEVDPQMGDALDVFQKENQTFFLKRYVQYMEWQTDAYLNFSYYEVRDARLSGLIFHFLLKVKNVNEMNGYRLVDGKLFGADEVYRSDFSQSMYLRKGSHIIEIQYTSENLESILWQKKMKQMLSKW